MRRRRLRRATTALLGALAGGAVLAACGMGAVELAPADLDADARTTCDELLAELPQHVQGGTRRDVSPYGAGAAWGDPPVTLRCGTTAAVGMNPAMQCQVVDGVGWYAEELQGGYRFTTIGRATPVEVVVPSTGDQASGSLVDVAPAIKATVAEVQPCV